MTYALIKAPQRHGGMWEWYAVFPRNYIRELAELRQDIPPNYVYVAMFATEDDARKYGRRHGWCE